ncbi:Protein required for cell viability Rrp17, putative [Penicillium digitatum]|uniref:Protein required for cell viability Rrp17, putative n=3 Tax=Penicillium digitatum TaxID=36651 RepID=K9GAN0_PEND2|nr:Protein required for cell viability Rrp17, putative [Penicillium digitatum Pd1]EKV05568.1 Protein required for cell viability Rrp17, putative [Penicillium digitatum Pd1]EKV18149.1 Protein required for cell viability Rrp17, putative [Penicillium digitatum PHI26]QQK40371.1 Protein required for cell viability Rrp17, putative [Penicillium digitatum]
MGPKDLKKRKIVAGPKVEEVNFDSESRQEWLTGFHKRKVQRAKHAQENAAKRYKEEKREARKKIREDRKKDFEQAMAEHKAVLKRMKEDAGDLGEMEGEKEEEDWEGIEEPPAVDYEAEYIDEDKYTTVTVEEMDASREGLLKAAKGEDSENEEEKKYPVESEADTKAKKRKPRSAASEAARKKKRNFRYETKVERRQTMLKQRSVKAKKAKARKGAEE